ncbi:hypothetical protein [Sporomusa termitida]|uniref:Uncharacterized protein n=1 Tax=Sporomusa termitida TaxID=2377 RepID=A0A517DS95_9FIRM|nr:hypothetical protein [Sporomusa termitida]QDR80233.1 hypothetical protein SPTER_15520 [Sporomusa termitida]
MPKLSNKHGERAQVLTFADFTGGLRKDIAPNSEKFLPNMLQKATNVEIDYSSGKLKVAAGLVPVVTLPAAADTLFYNYKDNYFLTNCGQSLYKLRGYLSPNTTPELIGQLKGIKRPAYAVYGPYTAIVSGNRVQYVDYFNAFKMASGSPVSDMCYVRGGRLATSNTGSDIVYFCGVGDIENWNYGTDNLQDAWYAEVGYQDGGGIVAVKQLFGNVVVIKRSGKTFRLVGDYNWDVYDGPEGVYVAGPEAIRFAGNGLYYVGKDGFSVMGFNSGEYGTLRSSEVGAAVNQDLMQGVSQNAKIWDIQPKKQLWVRTDDMGTTYLFHYFSGVFTVRKFSMPISDVCLVGNTVYVLSGDTIYRLDETADTEVAGNPIQVDVEGKLYTTINDFLIKRIAVAVDAKSAAAANVAVSKVQLPIGYTAESPYVHDATGYLHDANYPLWTLARTTPASKRQIYRTKEFSMRLTSTKGAFALNDVKVEVVEV